MKKLSVLVKLEDLMSLTQAAELLGDSRQAVHSAWKRGRIAGYQIDNIILLDRPSVEEYKRTRRVIKPKKKVTS